MRAGQCERSLSPSRPSASYLAGQVCGLGPDTPAKKFAVIVDEAHSSQTGEAADALKRALGPVQAGTGVGQVAAERMPQPMRRHVLDPGPPRTHGDQFV